MNTKTIAAIGAGVVAAIAVGLVATAAAAPTQPAGGGPWTVTNGHRYKVTLTLKPGAGATSLPVITGAIAGNNVPGGFIAVPGSASGSFGGTGSYQDFVSYEVDYVGATGSLAASTFFLGLPGGAVDVTLQDLGLSPGQTAGATRPSSSTTPPGATGPGGPTTGPFAGYGTPYTPPGTPATSPPAGGGGGPPLVTVTPPATPPPSISTPPTAAPPSSGQAPTGPAGNWVRTQSVPAYAAARFTMTPDQLSSFVANIGGTGNPPDMTDPTNARKSFEQTFLLQHVQGQLQSRLFFAWGPGEALPSDWPPDDPHLTDGYHVEMVYGVGYLLAQASIPNPPAFGPATLATLGLAVSGFWGILGGTGQTITQGPITWTKASTVNPGDHVRVSFYGADVQALVANIANSVPGLNNLAGGVTCNAFLLFCNDPTGFARFYGAPGMNAWCPGDALPPDWPSDDTQAAGEFHLELRSNAPAFASGPIPNAQHWVASGAGA